MRRLKESSHSLKKQQTKHQENQEKGDLEDLKGESKVTLVAGDDVDPGRHQRR